MFPDLGLDPWSLCSKRDLSECQTTPSVYYFLPSIQNSITLIKILLSFVWKPLLSSFIYLIGTPSFFYSEGLHPPRTLLLTSCFFSLVLPFFLLFHEDPSVSNSFIPFHDTSLKPRYMFSKWHDGWTMVEVKFWTVWVGILSQRYKDLLKWENVRWPELSGLCSIRVSRGGLLKLNSSSPPTLTFYYLSS